MHYGHELQFGTFITPGNNPPETALALGVLSEDLGFDLVTYQDHPYQPRFLDTWTLLTWVAARTERIQVSANVLNLPLRPATVTARAAASLDLLTHGRFNLGLGAGGFLKAIAAMGGPRLTSGQAVDALSEGIDVIRGIWDTSERSPLDVDGKHYQLVAAKRGPAPAHDIPIWLGAYRPRMLRLTGRKADGWLPSLGAMNSAEFGRSNAVIDEAALAVGRDPREIRRLVNIGGQFRPTGDGFLDGPNTKWVDDLLPFVIEHGVGTLILASDDPATMQRFAAEVAPVLREAVAQETAGSR
jgi:alkanesulfonate monooxygenase SsuD/methylene tetrahydromethanopterin reductase-like flavin-dependent oxidoreductase (luciferase family)